MEGEKDSLFLDISKIAHFDNEKALDVILSSFSCLYKNSKLKIVCENNSRLKKFPLKILYKYFPNIISISCYNNFNLKYFDGDLSVFNSLEEFICSKCVNLEVFPSSLPPNIKILHIIKNKKLKSFPNGIFNGTGNGSGSLQHFVCGDMRELVALPVDFGVHKSTIKYIMIACNKNLVSISNDFVSGCTSLEKIVFSCNNSLLTLKNMTLPFSLKDIKIFRNRSLQDFPVFSKKNSSLEVIELVENKKTIPFSFESIINSSSSIKVISLSNVHIIKDKQLPSFEQLKVFILANSTLTASFPILPKSLLHLSYSNNSSSSSFRTDDIFKKISHLANLKVIKITNTLDLKAIPDHFFSDFSFLEEIDFSRNDIQEIPTAILNLKIENVRFLNFGHNYNMKEPSEIILDHITQRKKGNITGFYTDNQNVHTSSFQKYYKKTVEKLLKEYAVAPLGADSLNAETETLQLNEDQKISFEDVKRAVEKKIASHPDRLEIEKIISTEVKNDNNICVSGKIIQLMKCLEGFFEKEEKEEEKQEEEELLSLQQRISSILNYIITVKKVTDISDIRKEIYEDRGFESEKEFIEKILESIF